MKSVTCTVTSAFVYEGTIVAPGPKGKPRKIDLPENWAKNLTRRGKVEIGFAEAAPEQTKPAAKKPEATKPAAKKPAAKTPTAAKAAAATPANSADKGKDGDGGS